MIFCHKMSYRSLTCSKSRAAMHLLECMLLLNTCILINMILIDKIFKKIETCKVFLVFRSFRDVTN